MKKIAILIIVCFAFMSFIRAAESESNHKFKNPEQQRKYNDAKHEQAYWETEQKRQEATANELERQDRKFKPLREASVETFKAGAVVAAGPVHGYVAGKAYEDGIKSMTDPEANARARQNREKSKLRLEQAKEKSRLKREQAIKKKQELAQK